MSTNRHALIRYRTIDRCLRDPEHNYNLQGLIDACSNAISEHMGQQVEVKRRTVLYDLAFMKDDKSGFSAPIANDRKEGYYYTRSDFSIFRAEIKKSDLDVLKSSLLELQGISGKRGFEDLESVITRLEEAYNIRHSRNAKPVIQFEHSTNIDGQRHVATLKKYILDKQPLQIRYEPFDAKEYVRYICPYLLKEYNNRWFLIGHEFETDWEITVLALDRINTMGISLRDFYMHPDFDPDTYHQDIIGVTLPQGVKKKKIVFKAYGKTRHYLNTKPLHHSQKLIKMKKKYGLFSIKVIPNPELESKLLGYGEQVEVVEPEGLRDQIASCLSDGVDLYAAKKPTKDSKKRQRGKKTKK